MNNNLNLLYQTTLAKYRKFKVRLIKNIESGTFEEFSERKQKQVLNRLERLKRRLSDLKLQIKLALVSGALVFTLNTGQAQGPRLGPFVQVNGLNPFRPEVVNETNEHMSFVDIDGDGDNDLFVGLADGTIEFYENIGSALNPGFEPRTGVQNPANGIDVGVNAYPVFEDIDGDGDFDLIAGSSLFLLNLFTNNGSFTNPSFSATADVTPNAVSDITSTKYYNRPVFVDIDNDGDLDAFVGQDYSVTYNTNSTILFFEYDENTNTFGEITGVGNPVYNATSVLHIAGGKSYPEFVDIDNDGDQDLIVGDENGFLRFFENTGTADTPEFLAETIGPSNPFDGLQIYTNASPKFEDIDGDGDFDLFVNYAGFGVPSFFENTGNSSTPNFIERYGSDNPLGGANLDSDQTFTVTTADIDGDSFIDIVYGSSYGNTSLGFLRNKQNGTFEQKFGSDNPFMGVIPINSYRPSPAFSDIDGDGDLDLFISLVDPGNLDEADIIFFENQGNNTFISQPSPLSKTQTYNEFAVTIDDFDGDGDDDAIVGQDNFYDGFLYFRNDGNSTNPDFNEQPQSDPPFNGTTLGSGIGERPFMVDLDHDGDMDVVSGRGGNPGSLIFFANDGTGNLVREFARDPFIYQNAGFDTQPAFLDADNDGDLDIFVGQNSEIRFFQNQNQPPVVNTISSPLSFTEGDPFLNLDAALTIADDSTDFIIEARVQVQNYVNGQDVLSFTPSGGVAGNFFTSGPNAGSLILTGTSDLAVYQAILRTVQYQNISDNPNVSPKTIQISATDFDNTDPFSDDIPEPIISITIVPINDPPAATSSSNPNAIYTEDDTPGVLIDGNFIVTDVDNATLVSATVRITTGFLATEDLLEFTDQNGITGSYNSTTGRLTLTGSSSVGNYQTALRSVRYSNSSQEPDNSNRTIRISVNDGTADSNLATRTVLVVPVNDAPVVSSNNTTDISYDQGTTAVVVDDLINIIDVDDTQLISATVTVGGYQTGDILVGTAPAGTTLNFDTSNGILTITGTTSLANYITALSGITFTSDQSGTRQLSFVVNDGSDDSNIYLRNLNIISPNIAPIISSINTGAVDYQQNDPETILDAQLSISDPDDTDLENLTVTITGYVTGDVLSITEPTGTTANFDNAAGILSITGTASVVDYQTALQSLSFSSTNGAGSRAFDIIANDGVDNSNTFNINLNIIDQNVAPVVSSINTAVVEYQQNDPETILDAQLSISDADDTDLENLTVTITGYVTGDILLITEPPGTTANFDNATGILSITGTATVIDYQTALQSLSFSSTNGAGSRVIDIVVNDGDDDSNAFNIEINIINEVDTQPPVVNTTPTTTQVGSQVTIDLCNIISDPDNTFGELTITVVNILSGAVTTVNDCDLVIDYSNTGFSGRDQIVLRATDPDGNSAENTLFIDVEDTEPGGDLVIYNAISPNGDGANDWWEIVNLTTPNKIELYNRWGDLVKTLNDYENIENNTQLDDLSVGTYFYKISSPQGEYTGYITIKK